METSRRNLLAAGTVLTALMATRSNAQSKAIEPGTMEVIHVHTGQDGVSHMKRVTVSGMPKPLPVESATASFHTKGIEDWHVAPFKTFTINIYGDIEGEMGDGTKVAIGKGDLVYLDDMTGKGHVTRMLTDVANLFLRMKPDFDFEAWASDGA